MDVGEGEEECINMCGSRSTGMSVEGNYLTNRPSVWRKNESEV